MWSPEQLDHVCKDCRRLCNGCADQYCSDEYDSGASADFCESCTEESERADLVANLRPHVRENLQTIEELMVRYLSDGLLLHELQVELDRLRKVG